MPRVRRWEKYSPAVSLTYAVQGAAEGTPTYLLQGFVCFRPAPTAQRVQATLCSAVRQGLPLDREAL